MLSKHLLPNLKRTARSFVIEEDGQGINEYAACMAFVALLAILAFTMTHGTMAQALLGSYDSMTNQFDRLNNARP